MPKPIDKARMDIFKSYEARAIRKRSLAVRFADDLTSFFGSIPFLTINGVIFILWILINTGKVPLIAPYDPFPFPMLTTVVSLEAIILTVIVLMSQNRQSLISSLREEMDMHVNLIAEREITKALKLLNELLQEKGIKLKDEELEEMLKEIDASYLERKLEEELAKKPPSIVEKVTEPIVEATEKVGETVEKTLRSK